MNKYTHIERTKLSPSIREISWLQHTLVKISPQSFLEFGAGLTSKIIYETSNPNPYVIIENFDPIIEAIKNDIPTANLITTTWTEIPQIQYDAVLIDSSAGYPPAPTKPGLRRLDALKWCIKYNLIKDYVIIHDAFSLSGKRLYAFLIKDQNFKLHSEIRSKHGFAMFQKL